MFGITNAQGKQGLELYQFDGFEVQVRNDTDDPKVIHWHGLTPPFAHDGSNVSQAVIAGGGSHDYRFDLARSGTHWMHSHHGLQAVDLMAAPLIVRADSERNIDRQDVTVLLQDFSFTEPAETFAGLRGGTLAPVASGMAAMNMGIVRGGNASMPAMDHGQMAMSGGQMDLNDVTFGAYLANDRDLSDPEVVQVDRGSTVRLRIVNAASSTNF